MSGEVSTRGGVVQCPTTDRKVLGTNLEIGILLCGCHIVVSPVSVVTIN